jgi:hypothetical protein
MSRIYALSSLVVVFSIACASQRPSAAPSNPAPPQPRTPEAVPFQPGPLPDGWKLDGVVGAAVQFAHPERDSAVAFIFFTALQHTPESMIGRAADEMRAKGVTVTDFDVPTGGTEASLRYEDRRLWHADKEEQGFQDYGTFLSWVRLDP